MSLICYKTYLKENRVVIASDGIVLSGSNIVSIDKSDKVFDIADDHSIMCGVIGCNSFDAYIRDNAKDFNSSSYYQGKIAYLTKFFKDKFLEYKELTTYGESNDFECDFGGLIFDSHGDVFSIYNYPKEKQILVSAEKQEYGAIDCGREFAVGAMDHGATPEQAVKIGAKNNQNVSNHVTIKKLIINH